MNLNDEEQRIVRRALQVAISDHEHELQLMGEYGAKDMRNFYRDEIKQFASLLNRCIPPVQPRG